MSFKVCSTKGYWKNVNIDFTGSKNTEGLVMLAGREVAVVVCKQVKSIGVFPAVGLSIN